jgi:flagellar biosynthesis/type III secretory pathway protein FliH
MNDIDVSTQEKQTLMVRLFHDRFELGEALGLQKGEALGLQKGEALGLQKGEALGLQKGEALGLQKGRRDSFLEMAAQLLPDQLAELAALTDVDELARQVTARLRVHRG